MSKSFGETTAPEAASTVQESNGPTSMALVIAASTSEPHRVGQVALLPLRERLFLGRGDVERSKFVHFGWQRPGRPYAVDQCESFVAGDTISRRQLRLMSTGSAIEMERLGRCRTYVNGQECERATLHPGDTVLLKGELLLVCVQRPLLLARPLPERELQAVGQPDEDGIVGESPAIWRLREQLALAARKRDHVLIQGESGAGKELAAIAVHRQSDRARGPLVSHNASTFSPALVASELFGNPANYPNPGMPARKGLIGEADRGTLFLDEIGEFPKEGQAQLLRVMENGEYQAVGEAIARRVDVRVVAATNSDDSFGRSDFLARFLVRVRVPPLRERREDIPLLIRHLLVQRARELPEIRERFLQKGPDGRLHPRISGRLVDHLLRQPLPLNTRELHAILVKAIEASPGDKLTMPADDVPFLRSLLPVPAPDASTARDPAPPAPSKEAVVACLDAARGNIVRAATALGVSRSALYRLMEKHGIERQLEN